MPARNAPPRSRPLRRDRDAAPATRKRAQERPRATRKEAQVEVVRPLTATQKRYLRGIAHALKPVILVGQKGVTDALLAELDGALSHHELVKVRLADDDREARAASIAGIGERTGAELVQTIGKVACFYRRNPDRAQFALPK